MVALARSLNCLVALYLAGLAPPSFQARPVAVRGKVLTLAEALASRDLKIKPDSGPIEKQVVLLAEDGDNSLLSTMQVAHCSLMNGCAIVEVRFRAGDMSEYLSRLSRSKVERDGRLRTPEYYCRCASTCPRRFARALGPHGAANAARAALIEGDR